MINTKITLTPVEAEALREFFQDHLHGQITITQDGSSGIGIATHVMCGCGIDKNITDYDVW